VQLSLFSVGAASNAVFICMAADGISFLVAVGFFFELHPQQTAMTEMIKGIAFMLIYLS
jgi:hypothetical protein